MSSEPTTHWRRNLFIVCILGVQLGLPLRYYLGNDPFDERFAWRMFSAERMADCQVRFTQANKRVDHKQRFHLVWNNLANRGRGPVLDRMVEQLCDEGGPVTVQATCSIPGQDVELHDGRSNLCEPSK